MSEFEDEGGDAPCWAHEFEEELFGDDHGDEGQEPVEPGGRGE